MKKQTAAHAAFRHHNPVARLVSTVAAFAIATLLVVGSGAAYGDGTDPTAPADTSASSPSADLPTDTPSDPPADTGSSDTAAASSDSAGDPTAATGTDAASAPGAETSKSDAGKGSPPAGPTTTLRTLARADVTPALVGNADCQDSANTMVGGFEIDADPCDDEGGIDFLGGCPTPPAEPGCPGTSVDDGFGDDGNWFTQGSSENDNPATWTLTGSSNTGKADIGTAWAWSHTYSPGDIDPNTPGVQLDPNDGHVYAYFGFTNDSTAGGTQDYSLEYNQADPVSGKPVRTVGDLLFHFFANGAAGLEYKASYIYTDDYPDFDKDGCVESGTLGAGWCPFDLPANAYVSASSPTGEYAEGSIDITILFGEGNCSPVFGTTFLRSAPGAFFTSELKDYVSPLDVTTASTCGSLVITKTDADTHDPAVKVGGGVYRIVGDPRPDGVGGADYQLCIYDGPTNGLAQLTTDHPSLTDEDVCDELIADNSADGTVTVDPVEPGHYTVTEIVPPPGYMLNGDGSDSSSVDVDEGEEQPVGFSNRRIWQPLNITKDATGSHGARYFWDITKQIAPTADGPWTDHPNNNAPLVKSVDAGGDTSLYYRLQVTQGRVETSNYVVTGTIYLDNPNDGDVAAHVTESLAGCTLDSDGSEFPIDVTVPGDSVDRPYAYTCDLGDGPVSAGTNQATVSWDMNDYPQATAALLPDTNPDHYTDSGTDGYTFAETAPVDKTITVTDDHFVFDPAWTIAWNDDNTTEDGDPVGVYDSGVYSYDTQTDAGTCSAVITNTATIHGDNDADIGHTSENGQVCVEDDLSVNVSSDESLTRTFPWDIGKSTTTPVLTNTAGSVVAHYQVVITALESEDSGWTMTGTATITNPNDFVDKQVSDLDVAYNGDACVLDGLLPEVPRKAGGVAGTADVDFHCTFDSETPPALDGQVTVTVKWDADAASATDPTPAQVTEANWLSDPDTVLVNQFIKVFDDHAVPGTEDPLFGGVQLKWDDVWAETEPAHQVSVGYDHTYTGSAMPAAGACNNLVNTAWFTGDAATESLDSATATVQVCTPAVIVSPPRPPQVSPPAVLPNTGGPGGWLPAGGLALLLAGGVLVAADRRHRRRS